MTKWWIECVQRGFLRKFWSNFILDICLCKFFKKFDSNIYELAIPHSLGINPAFNVEDPNPYRAPFDYLAMISDLFSSTSLEHWFFLVVHLHPNRRLDEIENIWDDEIILTADGRYQHYLRRWHGRPDSDWIWLHTKKV